MFVLVHKPKKVHNYKKTQGEINMSIARLISNILYYYSMLIILRVFLTWIPNIDWYQQPFRAIREISDVYLDIFKKFIPPIGALDISPIIALIVLQLLRGIIASFTF